jgi:hypothetical protein
VELRPGALVLALSLLDRGRSPARVDVHHVPRGVGLDPRGAEPVRQPNGGRAAPRGARSVSEPRQPAGQAGHPADLAGPQAPCVTSARGDVPVAGAPSCRSRGSLQGSASRSWRLDGGCQAHGISVALAVQRGAAGFRRTPPSGSSTAPWAAAPGPGAHSRGSASPLERSLGSRASHVRAAGEAGGARPERQPAVRRAPSMHTVARDLAAR